MHAYYFVQLIVCIGLLYKSIIDGCVVYSPIGPMYLLYVVSTGVGSIEGWRLVVIEITSVREELSRNTGHYSTSMGEELR